MKRSKAQRGRDRRLIASLYLKGEYQADIAAAVGVSQGTVSKELSSLQEEWRQSSLVDINEAKARELAKIDTLELEYWTAWKRSQENAETEITKMQGSDPEKPGKLEKQMKSEGQSGNPAFLRGVEWCINKRCEIIGINAPTKIAPTDPTGKKPYEPKVDDERFDRAITTLADAIRESVPGTGAKPDGKVGPAE